MPIVSYWESEGFVYKASGVMTTEEILNSMAVFLRVPKGIIPKYQLFDALDVEEIRMSEIDLVNISADDLSVSRKFPRMKIAMIATEGPVMENFVKYLKISWNMNTTWDIRIFNSFEAARDWLDFAVAHSNSPTQ